MVAQGATEIFNLGNKLSRRGQAGRCLGPGPAILGFRAIEAEKHVDSRDTAIQEETQPDTPESEHQGDQFNSNGES